MDGNNKYKFLAAVSFMFLLPFLVLSGHFFSGNRELEKRDALSYMEFRTRTAANIAADLLTLNYDISRLAASRELLSVSGAARKKLLEEKIREKPSIYSEFSILNAVGKEVLKTGSPAPKELKDYSKTELFRSAVSGNEPAGAVEYGEYTPPALVLAEPLAGRRGARADGFLLARMSLAYLGEVVRAMGRNSPGNLGFMDAGGQLISDSLGHSIITPGIKAPAEVLKAAAAASARGLDAFRGEVSSRGRPSLVSVANIPGTRWWVFEVVDASALPDYSAAFWVGRVILTGVFLILVFSFVSYKLAVLWLKPE